MNNQAAVLYAPHDIRIEERPVPKPGPREVLIEIKAVGVCGSDVHYYEHGRIGSYIVLQPLILGHESAGVIVDVGEGVSKSRIGERVAIEPGIPDGTCQQCRTGHYNLCPNVRFFGTPPIDGAFTNYVTVPDSFAYTLPASMSDEEGALIEPLSVGLWACRKAQLRGADHVLITGAGPVGMLAMKVALALDRMLGQPEGHDGWHSLATPSWKGRCGWYEPGRRGQCADVVPAKPRDNPHGNVPLCEHVCRCDCDGRDGSH